MMRELRNRKILILLLLLCMTLFTGCSSGDSGGGVFHKPEPIAKDFDGIQEIPAGYSKPIEHHGSLSTISYEFDLDNGSGYTAEKKATVYLPYDYDENKQYDIMYLIHGYGGDYHTFLGSKDAPRRFANMLDHMIEDRRIAPMIVVTPTFTEEYYDYYTELDGMSTEIVKALAPAVESKYSTFAESTDKDGLIASRAHRGIGGFSMGGCATWRALRSYKDYFEYYLPISMPMYYSDYGYQEGESTWSAKEIAYGVNTSDDPESEFYVFAASGTEDFMCEATEMQVEHLCDYDGFTYTDTNFSEGNMMFHAWEGRGHHTSLTLPYFYNGLIRFFRDSTGE